MSAFGVWAKCCRTCQTVEVCRDYDSLAAATERHVGHYTEVAGGRDVVFAGQLAEKLSPEFRGIYWDAKLDEALTTEKRGSAP